MIQLDRARPSRTSTAPAKAEPILKQKSTASTEQSPESWRRALLEYIANHPDRPQKPRALARELRVPTEDYTAFRAVIRDLLAGGEIVLGRGRALALPHHGGVFSGTFCAHRRGFGFIRAAGAADVYVGRGQTRGALDGDLVQARRIHGDGRRGTAQVEIIRILERAPQRWVGVLERRGRDWFVRPRGGTLDEVQIVAPATGTARAGEMVLVEPRDTGRRTAQVQGVIVERLGAPGATATQIRAVLRRHAIPEEFPAAVSAAARQLAAEFDPEAVAARTDLRGLRTITIDPVDARDYDDAISVERRADGRLRLGVHIADVAHFVRAGDVLDREALERGNSVYFPGYVVPMLPEALSNGVCSLQPGQPRFTKSVFITYDRAGEVVETSFANSVIRSAARLTYQQVTAALDGETEQVDAAVLPLLREAARLAERIRKRRLAAGMITLALPEVAIRLDAGGRVIDAGPADTGFSHTIVEMFMIEANEAVSRLLRGLGVRHLRRIHPTPDPDDGTLLAQLTPVFGRPVPRSLARENILRLLDASRGRSEEAAVHFVLLRSLAQARYAASDEGHFALASEDYCHFTSPIRRYPDLTVHRLLDAHLRGDLAGSRRRSRGLVPDGAALDEIGRHTSATERRAQQAEREVKTLLLLELMKRKIGAELDGIVTGVMQFGAFVRVDPYMAEGLVRASDCGAEGWDFDQNRGVLTARRSRRVVGLGQRVRVRVAGVDEVRQELQLVPAQVGAFGVKAAGAVPQADEPRRAGRRGRGR